MTLFYIQPLLAGYRVPLLLKLTEQYRVKVLAESGRESSAGFNVNRPEQAAYINTPIKPFLKEKLFFQFGVLSSIWQGRPEKVISFANPRFLSFWLSLLLCRTLRIQFYSHGQGLYAYPNPSKLKKMMYRAMVHLSTKYICYTKTAYQSLLDAGCVADQLAVAENSLELTHTVKNSEKKYDENGILFIGRIREGCQLDLLIAALDKVSKTHPDIRLHVIGGGEQLPLYKKKYSEYQWINWYGAIYDEEEIANISRECRFGCYPGDAGLSIVHMFALSLPPLIHDSLHEHMGPEPSYVENGKNGYLFSKRKGLESLSERIETMCNLPSNELSEVARQGHKQYIALNTPPMGERFLNIVNN